MAKITPGSTIIGKSGKTLIVDRVDGDTIYSGDLKQPKEPGLEVKKDESGNITSF